jgi:hypothetical protein
VTIIACVYIVAGAGGTVVHLADQPRHHFEPSTLAIVAVSFLAIFAGAFMLRGADWARWLAILWMAFHVGISFLEGWQKVVIHAVFLAVIAYFLLRRDAGEYFSAADGG